MSGVPPKNRITLAQMPGAPRYLEPLIEFVNSLAEFNTQAFGRGGINIGQNVGTLKTVQIETPASYSAASSSFTRIRFFHGLTGLKARGVVPVEITDRDFPDAVLTGNYSCAGAWVDQGGEIIIDYVSGLEPSHRYELTFWVVA